MRPSHWLITPARGSHWPLAASPERHGADKHKESQEIQQTL